MSEANDPNDPTYIARRAVFHAFGDLMSAAFEAVLADPEMADEGVGVGDICMWTRSDGVTLYMAKPDPHSLMFQVVIPPEEMAVGALKLDIERFEKGEIEI